jgi:hypothetical protein
MMLKDWKSKGTGLYNKKVGLFSRKNPTFGVWLPIVDELRTFDDILDWTGIDSCKQ